MDERDTALASLICVRNDHPDAPACDGCYAMAAWLREHGYVRVAPSPDAPAGFVPVRLYSGGVLADGTTNTEPIDFLNPPPEVAPSPDAPGLRKALAEAAAGLEDAREWLASRAVAPEVQERIEAAQHLAGIALRVAPSPEEECSDPLTCEHIHPEALGVAPSPDAPGPRLMAAVRAVIADGIDAPGVHNELHAAYYEARDRAPSPDAPGLREAAMAVSARAIANTNTATGQPVWIVRDAEFSALRSALDPTDRMLVVAALAALPPRDALDVERLARAIVAIGYITDPDVAESVATRFAREYAAQSEEPTVDKSL